MSTPIPSRHTDWIQTFTGKQFFPFNPQPEQIDIRDIAHSLSNLCRYGGHVGHFYSVAEHSIHVSNIVPPEDALRGLLHDASEAYLIDVPRPIKHHPSMIQYRETEEVIQSTIYFAFGLITLDPPSIKKADNEMLRTEQRDLMKPAPVAWQDVRVGAREDIKIMLPLSPRQAESQFLYRFTSLTGWHPSYD